MAVDVALRAPVDEVMKLTVQLETPPTTSVLLKLRLLTEVPTPSFDAGFTGVESADVATEKFEAGLIAAPFVMATVNMPSVDPAREQLEPSVMTTT